MKARATAIPEVLVIEPEVFGDARGSFYESWNQRDFDALVGREVRFVQDNHSTSLRGVLRGMHFQNPRPQGKLVRVVEGEVFDAVVDLRRASPTFGRWVGERLSAENRRMLWVPEGFAHGFLVTSARAQFLYKATDYYAPEHDRTLMWNDPAVGIEWPLEGEPVMKPRDLAGLPLAKLEPFA
jgi:dTDP-4-dehydrorhamnose 3,5-epimerase